MAETVVSLTQEAQPAPLSWFYIWYNFGALYATISTRRSRSASPSARRSTAPAPTHSSRRCSQPSPTSALDPELVGDALVFMDAGVIAERVGCIIYQTIDIICAAA
jgi:hypothetical protein